MSSLMLAGAAAWRRFSSGGGGTRPPQTVLVMKPDQAPGAIEAFTDPVGKVWSRSGTDVFVAADPGGFGGSCILVPGNSANHKYVASHPDLHILGGDFTVEAFVRIPTSNPGGSYGTPVIAVPGASTTGWVLRLNTGQLQWVYPGLAALPHSTTWAANTTFHVMACRQGDNHYVGVNGIATAYPGGTRRTTTHTQLDIGSTSYVTMPAGNKYVAVRVVKGVALYPGTSYTVPTGPL